MLTNALATEQLKDQVKRTIAQQGGQLLYNQVQNQQWQKAFNFQKEREVDMSQNQLQSLHRRQYDLNS